jgi:hypothetical protein
MEHGDNLAILHHVQCHTCSLVITSTLRVGDFPFFRRELSLCTCTFDTQCICNGRFLFGYTNREHS